MAGHLGVNKTYCKLLTHFYWPKLKRDVAQFCRTCHVFQVVGKPNQLIPAAPLRPVPAYGEPFSDILIDCVGPLPKTKSGNKFLFTIMCKSTRFCKAIPLRSIKANKIVDTLIKFFTVKVISVRPRLELHVWYYAIGNLPAWHQAMQVFCVSPRVARSIRTLP